MYRAARKPTALVTGKASLACSLASGYHLPDFAFDYNHPRPWVNALVAPVFRGLSMHANDKTDGKGPLTALPGARTALVLLLTINLFNYIDRQVLASVESDIEREFFPESEYPYKDAAKTQRVDPTIEGQIGSLNTAFMVSYMLFAPLFGWLGDRMSRWLLVGIGVVLWSLASGATALAPTFTILFLTRCLVGVGEGAYGPVAPTVISDLYPVKQRGSKLAWFYVAIPVGSALGYVLGGVVAKITGDWRWAFYSVVAPGLMLGVWSFLMPEPPRGQADPGAVARKARMKDYVVLLKTPSYVLNTLGMTTMAFALGGIAFWMPRYIAEVRHAAPKEDVNIIFGGIIVVSGLGATLLGGWLGDKLQPRFSSSYFLVSGIAMALGFPMVLLVLYLPFPLAWVFVFLACFCLFFNTGPTNTILANVTHPSIRASAFALNILVIHALGDAVSPSIIGFIKGYSESWNIAFTVVSAMFLASGMLWLWGGLYLERDTAEAPRRLAPDAIKLLGPAPVQPEPAPPASLP
jgi:MFS family permease